MYRQARRRYGSDLTDAQWKALRRTSDAQRKREYGLRRVLDALFYLNKTGCQWRYLPPCFPPWTLVYYYFRRWRDSGLLARIHDALRASTRRAAGRDEQPSVAVIDSQSVKTSFQGGVRGFDGGKRVNGRKRHILTDTMGLLLVVLVHSARESDGEQAPWLLRRLQACGPIRRLERIYADQGYKGAPGGLVWRCFGWIWQVVEREPKSKGFVVLKKRSGRANARSLGLAATAGSTRITNGCVPRAKR